MKESINALEREKNTEQYKMVMVGGRVKAAGASLQHLYDVASPIIQASDSIEAAFETSKRFARFKDKPPIEIRMAFFPQDEGAMRTAFNGLGVYRPTIKTDQGPAGNVGHFYIGLDDNSKIDGTIIREEGVAVLEKFLERKLSQANLSSVQQKEINDLIRRVQQEFSSGNYRNTYEAICKLREAGRLTGIETTRKVGVGREEFFFFRPIKMKEKISIGRDIVDAISVKTQEVVYRTTRLAQKTKQYIFEGLSMEESILKTNETADNVSLGTNSGGLIYFQADVLIRKDGTFDVEKVNMPDLGMFLTQVDTPTQNSTLEEIKDINREIKNEVFDVVCRSTGKDVIFVTREEVLDNYEDTLEQLELSVFEEGLKEKGKNIKIGSLKSIENIPSGSSIILFNIGTDSSDFERLLRRVAKGELICFPDPFLKLFEKETTTFPIKKIEGKVLDKFLRVIAPSALKNPEGVYSKYLSINKALQLGGICEEDIIYFLINGSNAIVPTFRYDVKSFSEVYKCVENLRKKGKKVTDITAIPIPFKPEDAVIQGKDGPRLAVFRFTFVRKN